MNVYINNGEKIPNDDICYIIAKGGIYLKKKLDLIESITPVDTISFLNEMATFAKINIPKIPSRNFAEIFSFFKEVYEMYRSEAIVLLFYNKNKKTYKIYVPDQTVSTASLDYKADISVKDHILIGTIHSHGGMSAFHSTIDVRDEKNFDGIHITVGDISKDVMFDLSATISINGMRVPVLPEEYIDGVKFIEYTPYFPQMFRPKFVEINGVKHYQNTVKTKHGYVLNRPLKEGKRIFKKEWLSRVKERQYNNLFGEDYFKMVRGSSNIDYHPNSVVGKNFTEGDKNVVEDICDSCAFRNLKVNKQNMKKYSEKDCKNNFEVDYGNFDFMEW